MSFWGQKTFCLITGASRGIGKSIAIEFSKNVGKDSVFLLLARSADGLNETKKLMESVSQSKVIIAPTDLEKPDKNVYNDLIRSAAVDPSLFDQIILVHNAGSLGDISKTVLQQDDLDVIRNFYTFNLFSLLLLQAEFFKIFSDETKQRNIVQISSLGAVQPFKTWGLYCAVKSARDMVMRSIAAENPTIATFNYAPGPVQTDIYDEAVNHTGDKELQTYFETSRAEGKILTCEQTITKLVRLLGEKKYTKGEHVDYYDVE